MKHIVITTDGQTLALEKITQYDLIGYPVPVECTKKQFQKELPLWLEIFDKTWPTDEAPNQVIGKMV